MCSLGTGPDCTRSVQSGPVPKLHIYRRKIMKTVYLIRHGQTPGNAEKRYSGGRTDESLCEEGIKVAREAKKTYDEIFAPYDGNFRICVSPLKRALETAGILFGENRDDFTKIDNLKEMDFGLFEGKTYEELNGTPEFQVWVDSGGKDPIPEAETYEGFAKRIFEGLKEAVGQSTEDETLAIVCHGGTIMAAMSVLTGKDKYDFMVNNLCGYRIELENKDGEIHLLSYTGIDYGDNPRPDYRRSP